MFSKPDRRRFLCAFLGTLLFLLALTAIAAADGRMAALGFAESGPAFSFGWEENVLRLQFLGRKAAITLPVRLPVLPAAPSKLPVPAPSASHSLQKTAIQPPF